MARVYKGVELVNNKSLDVGDEELLAITSVLHALKRAHTAVQPCGKLCGLYLVVLARPQATKPQGHIVAKGFECILSHLLDQFS